MHGNWMFHQFLTVKKWIENLSARKSISMEGVDNTKLERDRYEGNTDLANGKKGLKTQWMTNEEEKNSFSETRQVANEK